MQTNKPFNGFVACTKPFLGFVPHGFFFSVDDHTNASNFYQRMLKNDNLFDEIRVHAIFNMSLLAAERGEYLAAQRYLKKQKNL